MGHEEIRTVKKSIRVGILIALLSLNPVVNAEPTHLYFGDTHLHTAWSMDAFSLGQNTMEGPETAYRWAQGLPVIHPRTRARVRIHTPLDFLVVADHAEFLGVLINVINDNPAFALSKSGQRLAAIYREQGFQRLFEAVVPMFGPQGTPEFAELNTPAVKQTLWNEHVAITERYNEPGKFTALNGWEWTSMPGGTNYHRVVVTDANEATANRFTPFSAQDSQRAEELWAWLAETERRTGARFVSIPHNSNISEGLMFPETTESGDPMTVDYARFRVRWEPVMEVTQIKGDSETHPALSPNDEFADFERYTSLFGDHGFKPNRGDYARTGLLRGLEITGRIGVNPYRFGLIGSTDSHTALASAEEDNFWGKLAKDSIPEVKAKPALPSSGGVTGWDMSASGLAAVWAEENTRRAILEAFRRREVYATTGTRIRLRFFGGWHFTARDTKSRDLAETGYRGGVPMGGELVDAPKRRAPRFLIHAVKDPNDANLDRVQVIKGWLDSSGQAHERVFNVAWSGDRNLDKDGALPAVGNTVDVETASYTNAIGAVELLTVWEDPEFDPSRHAFYYARVLQIPTPRHSLYDAVALRIDPAETKHPASIQERAYSSPIWYSP